MTRTETLMPWAMVKCNAVKDRKICAQTHKQNVLEEKTMFHFAEQQLSTLPEKIMWCRNSRQWQHWVCSLSSIVSFFIFFFLFFIQTQILILHRWEAQILFGKSHLIVGKFIHWVDGSVRTIHCLLRSRRENDSNTCKSEAEASSQVF